MNRLRLLTNLYIEKQYVKLHNNGQATVFAISNRGAGGEAKQRTRPSGLTAFRRKTAVFSRRDRPDC